jgi:putative FmdB family regulatory protein
MPIYEFKCESCGHEKEILIVRQSQLKGSNKLGCDKCRGMYKKVPSAAAFNIKGYNEANGYSNQKGKKKNGKTDKRRK